ncbi:uncharacterized membrane protein YcaP (DUF421 family) [Altererythrobacter atlanticus]|uniref:Uncharacterized protein n=1 Tax=Croceibacterium atlanticum TaxID=1267766 RepID=A0A0F7KRN3_9SPHN|nr:YetF domain-containing protein [Croceibacterium atlanticum]AKH41781.1 hypothetical protein WYH_00727 [Croceibacterium atlanticum]MBB5733246.1 uncharacterized membrane protein YcaP (DUF421 family) [Croceibacterium atlanticum]
MTFMFFDSWHDLFRVVVVTTCAYAALVLILRFAGKRSLAKLNIFDFVVTVAFGSTLATVLLSKDVSFAEGALAFAMLAFLQWFVAFLSLRLGWFRRLIRSDPRLLLRDGQFLEAPMRKERITHGEIEAAIRKAGHGNVEDVAAVVLETDGDLSVISGTPAERCSALRSVMNY